MRVQPARENWAECHYIEIIGALVGRPRLFRRRKTRILGRVELSEFDVREIGEFTKKNVARWMGTHGSPDWVELFPIQDFHAVCGDKELPWDTEESKQRFQKYYS